MPKQQKTTRKRKVTHVDEVTPGTEIVRAGNGLVAKGHNGFLRTYAPDVGDDIIEAVAEGMPLSFAAHLHKVPKATVEGWVSKGEDGDDEELSYFAAGVRAAQARFVQQAIEGIKDAGLSDAKQWTALMTLLERIYPEYFRRPSETKTTNVNIAVGIVERQLHEMHAAGEIVYEGG